MQVENDQADRIQKAIANFPKSWHKIRKINLMKLDQN